MRTIESIIVQRDKWGIQICEHQRRRATCKECGGGSICEHNHIRATCKECGGGSICEHNHIRSRCKECQLELERTRQFLKGIKHASN
jgi:hypothetical protein